MAKDNDGTPKPKGPGKKLRKIIKNARVAMLTTVAADGSFSITQSLAGAGSARLRVAVPGDAEHYEAASDPFAVRLALR